MLLQPFINYNLPDGWYIASSPILTANWKADKAGDVWTVPLGGGVGKLFRLGGLPINTSLAAYGNVARREFGSAAALPNSVSVSEVAMVSRSMPELERYYVRSAVKAIKAVVTGAKSETTKS